MPHGTHTEREALAAVMWNQPVNGIDWARLTELAETGEGDYAEVRAYTLATADAVLAAGYGREGGAA